LLLQHRTLCDAILARRPEEARTAMQTHIDFVRARVGDDPETAISGWTNASRAKAAKEKGGRAARATGEVKGEASGSGTVRRRRAAASRGA